MAIAPHVQCIAALGLLIAFGRAEAAEPGHRLSMAAGCGDTCDWPSHGVPQGLLQAGRCASGGAGDAPASVRSGILPKLGGLPSCLQPAFAALAAAIAEGAGQRPDKAAVRGRIARLFYEASVYYQPVMRRDVLCVTE
jgi:hypothetical protein